ACREHFRSTDNRASVRFSYDMQKDVSDLVHWLVAIHRWINQYMIQVQALGCVASIPIQSVLFEWSIEFRIRSERGHERSFVIGRANHESIRQTSPRCNSITRGQQLLCRIAGRKEAVCAYTESVHRGEHIAFVGIRERIVQPRHRSGGIAKGRMCGDVGYAF